MIRVAALTEPPALARALSERSRDARLRQLFDANYDSIWRLLRRLGVPAREADDLAQNVFIVASRRLDEIEPNRERAFLAGTAMRIALQAQRTRARDRGGLSTEDPDLELSPGPDAEVLLDQKRALEFLDRLLAEMPEELRSVLVLFEFGEMATAEIATALDIPTGTAASRLRRAREDLDARVTRAVLRGKSSGEKR
jgi:RNA polymerase sigma-70 factor (ECF subfamily)